MKVAQALVVAVVAAIAFNATSHICPDDAEHPCPGDDKGWRVVSPITSSQARSMPNGVLIRYPRAGQGCDCPYDTAKDGTNCGERSAYSKPGGKRPSCYTHDMVCKPGTTYKFTIGWCPYQPAD